MGAQASKVSRKLPTKARPETLQNVPKDSPATLEAAILAASGIPLVTNRTYDCSTNL